jgi:hypothetical protein
MNDSSKTTSRLVSMVFRVKAAFTMAMSQDSAISDHEGCRALGGDSSRQALSGTRRAHLPILARQASWNHRNPDSRDLLKLCFRQANARFEAANAENTYDLRYVLEQKQHTQDRKRGSAKYQ